MDERIDARAVARGDGKVNLLHVKRSSIIAAVALCLSASSVQAAPSQAERAAQTFVTGDARHGEALLERLVGQNSGTMNLAGVRAAGEVVAPLLTELGFETRWVDGSAWGRAGHLVATHRGSGRGQRILLIGHLDTVFEPDNRFTGYRVDGRRAIGPGVGDDKGGVVVIVQALRAMRAAGTLRNADVMVVLTGDEERVGSPLSAARRDLIAAGEWADVAIEYENLATDNGQEFGTVARRGSTTWTLDVTARTGHSSGIFGASAGYGAIFEAARILDRFRQELPEPNLTVNVGLLAGGTPAAIDVAAETASASGKTNIIPARAQARGDLRTLTPEQEAAARAEMQAIVATSPLNGAEATLSFSEAYPPMAPTAGNRALLTELNVVNRDLGLPEMAEFDPARRGAADSSFVAALADTIGGMGPAGGGAHAEGEWIDLDSIPRQALRSAVLIGRLAARRR